MTFTLVTENSQEVTLERVPYIRYPVQFQKDKDKIQALLNSSSKLNAMNSVYAKKLGHCVKQTNIRAQKIDRSHLNTFKMVIVDFLLQDQLEKVWFFQETFLMADTRMEEVLEIFFLTLNNADIWFGE